MDISNIIPHIEALIFASEKPLTTLELTELTNNAFGFMEDKINLDQVESAIEGIIEKYSASFYPFEMKQSGGGWQFLTKKDYHKTVAQLNGEKFLKRLSAASLETLAIIAYKQPITKGEVESIRGVNSDYSIQKLLEKELIVITGRNEELPGKPLVYTTSKSFMDYFGINSPDELPKIKEIFTDQGIEATVVNGIEETEADNESEPLELPDGPESEEGVLVVRGNGELIEEPPVVVDEETEAVDPEVLETSEEDDIVDKEVNEVFEQETYAAAQEEEEDLDPEEPGDEILSNKESSAENETEQVSAEDEISEAATTGDEPDSNEDTGEENKNEEITADDEHLETVTTVADPESNEDTGSENDIEEKPSADDDSDAGSTADNPDSDKYPGSENENERPSHDEETGGKNDRH